MTDELILKAIAGRRRALLALSRGAKGVIMSEERVRQPKLTFAAVQRFMGRMA